MIELNSVNKQSTNMTDLQTLRECTKVLGIGLIHTKDEAQRAFDELVDAHHPEFCDDDVCRETNKPIIERIAEAYLYLQRHEESFVILKDHATPTECGVHLRTLGQNCRTNCQNINAAISKLAASEESNNANNFFRPKHITIAETSTSCEDVLGACQIHEPECNIIEREEHIPAAIAFFKEAHGVDVSGNSGLIELGIDMVKDIPLYKYSEY